MTVKLLTIIYAMLLCTLCSCRQDERQAIKERAPKERVIVIQPFSDFSPSLTQHIYSDIKALNASTLLRQPIALPEQAFYKLRNRYRADTLIHFLSKYGSADTVIIGLTGKDISTTKGNKADWGIMGLGYCPGNACVVSTYRLSKDNVLSQFYKVAIHELGHTQGLPHCANKTCFMRDAEGGNHLNEEKDFCPVCKTYLIKKGWQLN